MKNRIEMFYQLSMRQKYYNKYHIGFKIKLSILTFFCAEQLRCVKLALAVALVTRLLILKLHH